MKTTHILLIAILIIVPIMPAVTTTENGAKKENGYEHLSSHHFVMHPDSETRHELLKSYSPDLRVYTTPTVASPKASRSLLSHLNYVPVERDQGSCGNCWVWAGTGILEVTLDVDEGIYDRLSVQYFNSKYNGGTGSNWAGNGGWLPDFAEFYDNEGFAIPWSNTNAFYADGHQTGAEGTSVPWQTISTEPNYAIAHCTSESIATHGVGQSAAVNNIKEVIDQGRAVWFGYFLATEADWSQFFNFWDYQSENAIWNPDFSCGSTWNSGGGGHAVLCVGYNDEDPNNAYWIMVNSWGTAYGGRPNGIFRLDMDMNYDCYFYDPYPLGYYSLYWQTLDVTYSIQHVSHSVNLASQEDTGETANQGTITFDGAMHSLPASVSKESGNYSATYSASDGYTFDHWQTTGNISVSSATSYLTTVTISGGGNLEAVYRKLTESLPTLASIGPQLIAGENSIYLIFADPTRMTSISSYDVASGGIVYGLFDHPQNQGFDSNPAYVVQTGLEKGKLAVSNKAFLFFGGPCPHWCVSYYENAGLTPVKFYYNVAAGTYNFVTQSGNTLASMSATADYNHEDMFAVEVLRDSNNNTIFIFYGFSWKGTWAAGIYFHGYLQNQISTLTNNYYVYHWSDLSADGVPQPNEIHQESP